MKKLDFIKKDGRKFYKISDDVCHQLLNEAKSALSYCYPKPQDGYAVAVLTAKGNVYTGASYISKTYTLTMHSEAVALAHAAQHSETDIVAITGPNCHICKQLIWESSLNSNIEIQIILEEDGQIKKIPISEVMPYPWPDKEGKT